jgi:electron transport complex protein RnfG
MMSVMTGVGTLCGLLIVIAYQLTLVPIKNNQATILRESVFEVMPGATKQITFAVDEAGDLKKLDAPDGPLQMIYAGYDDQGRLLGVAADGSGRGYAGGIQYLYTYSPDKQAIVGYKVLDCKETPGLGDRIISDPGFLGNFKELEAKLDGSGEKLANPIVTVKHGTKKQPWQIDAISGATISSKAVGRSLDESAEKMIPVIMKHLDEIRKAGSS